MSLAVFVDDPKYASGDRDRHFLEPAEFESYRTELRGTEPIRKRSHRLSEKEHDLFVYPPQFEEFER